MSTTSFFIFNGIGIIVSLVAIAVIVHATATVSGVARKGLRSLLKGFILIILSFFWALFFGQMITPSSLLTVQSVLLSFGMAMLIYSANKIFEIHERTKTNKT